MAKVASAPKTAKPAKPEKKLKKVWFLPSLQIGDPSQMVQKWMVDEEPEVGTKMRLFDKPETSKTGFSTGIWGHNLADTQAEIYVWAEKTLQEELGRLTENLERVGEEIGRWEAFLATL